MSAVRGGQLFAERAGRRAFGRRRVRDCGGGGRADLKRGRLEARGGGRGGEAGSLQSASSRSRGDGPLAPAPPAAVVRL